VLARDVYYELKPFLPMRIRFALRRVWARRRRKLFQDSWPILPAAGKRPDGWPGWPEQKNFAFVLTHDVEGPGGLAKCRRLAELEMKMGFRSSFNFVPEGEYMVPTELREWLTENGFEVGVHDLHHDGRLFSSRRSFLQNAEIINRYLINWNASGFRAGFMLRQLDWYHSLHIEYDASTFDTDPFEPQPEGAGTIFPFWIPSPTTSTEATKEKSYVELPYTLPQDSTLFLVLEESTPEIWLRKLDWVAAQGGMGLVNVHPDYLCFPDDKPGFTTYPLSHYEQLLNHLRERYIDSSWRALPREIAMFIHKYFPMHHPSTPDRHS